jgi:hypothetical protein
VNRPQGLRAAAVGWRARDALARARGLATVVATLSDSMYLDAGGELIWLGGGDAPMHGRTVIAGGPLSRLHRSARPASPVVSIAVDSATVWRPRPLPAGVDRSVLGRRARALAAAVTAGLEPPGFGALLAGGRPDFPLDRVTDAALAFAAACAAGDGAAAAEAADPLVGCGPGLTPAGDDYVGGALFARAIFPAPRAGAPDRLPAAGAWRAPLERVLALAASRTHPISAVLLRDMVAGHGHAPLHDLAAALAASTPPDADSGRAHDAALHAARRLSRIGHSSGWDALAGFLAALG